MIRKQLIKISSKISLFLLRIMAGNDSFSVPQNLNSRTDLEDEVG